MNNLKDILERLDILDNPNSGRIKKVASLSRRSLRKKYGSLLVEGIQNFKEIVSDDNNAKYVKDIYLSESVVKKHPEFYHDATNLTMWVHICTDKVIESISCDAQGIVCVINSDIFLQDVCDIDFTRLRRIVLLPHIQDPGNLGTIIRSADAFDADLVVVCKSSVDVTSPKVIRSCAGSVFHIPILYNVDYKDFVRKAKSVNINVLGTCADKNSISLNFMIEDFYQRKFCANSSDISIRLEDPTCWVFGNEAHGMSVQEKDLCTSVVKIDMNGLAESLNVSVAASVCLYASSVTD